MDEFAKLLLILEELKDLINSPDTDICISRFNSIDEVNQFIDLHIGKTMKKDPLVFDDLKIFFAPTGPLQEISLSNGWGYLYLELADKFDNLRKSS